MVFRGLIASPDGTKFYDTTREGNPEDAVAMGHDAGMELKVKLYPSGDPSHLPCSPNDGAFISYKLHDGHISRLNENPERFCSQSHFPRLDGPLVSNSRPTCSLVYPLVLTHPIALLSPRVVMRAVIDCVCFHGGGVCPSEIGNRAGAEEGRTGIFRHFF